MDREIILIEQLLNESIINEIQAAQLRIVGKYGMGKVYPKGELSSKAIKK